MKRKTYISLKSLSTALVMGIFLLPMLATAQERDDKPQLRPSGDGRPQAQARPQGGQPRGDYFLMRFREILNEKQVASLREKLEASRESMNEIGKKILEKRRGMMGLVLAQPTDKKAIRAAFKELAKLESEVAIMRSEMIASIKPPLSEEQVEQLKQPPPRRPQGRTQGRPQQPRPPERPQRPPAERKSLDELIKRGDNGGGDRPPRNSIPQRPPREPKPE